MAEPEADTATETEVHVNPAMHLVAPLVAIIGTMIVRKVLTTAYQRATGRKAPDARDPQVTWMRAITWTATTAAAAAVTEVVIFRMSNRVGASNREITPG